MIGRVLNGTVLVVFAVVISLAALKGFSAPYLWILLTWGSVALCAFWLAPRAKNVWVAVVAVIFVFAVLEAYFWVSQNWIFTEVAREGTFTWVQDDLLGFRAARGVAQTEAKEYKGKKLFDATYTMGPNGLRVASAQPPTTKGNLPCVLFFGGGYTFGYGLNDQETLPYRVWVRSGGKYRVYNLGFITHGAQQMLAYLDHNLLSEEVECAPRDVKYVIYSAVPDDVRRAAGLRTIDHLHGPRYALGADGAVSYMGQFGEKQTLAQKIQSQLDKSWLYRKLKGGDAVYYRRYRDADVDLYVAIVNAARKRITSMYPNAELHVLLWENDDLDKSGTLAKKMLKGLSGAGLTVHRIEEILPGSAEDKSEYFLAGLWESDPNAFADDRIAEYVVGHILKQKRNLPRAASHQ
jgi:hypothetical protein